MYTTHYHHSDLHKRTKFIIILLSLLLNILLLIMLGLIEPLKDTGDSFFLIPTHEENSFTQPNQSQVYFQNLPPSAPAMPAATPQAMPQPMPQQKQWVSLNGGNPNIADDDATDEPAPQHMPMQAPLNAPAAQEESEGEDDATDAHEETTDTDSAANEHMPMQEKKPTMMSTPTSSTSPTSQALARTRKRRPAKKSTSNLTMSQLVQGFLDPKAHARPATTTRGFGNAAAMEGKGYGVPSKAQLMYERYIQRIVQCLQSAYEANKYSLPSTRMRVEPIDIAFSLDAQGKVVHITIARSSKNILMDQFVLTVFQDASTSFPPVPALIYESPFNLQCIDALLIMSERNRQIVIK